jgi:hypothetical protein
VETNYDGLLNKGRFKSDKNSLKHVMATTIGLTKNVKLFFRKSFTKQSNRFVYGCIKTETG